MHTSYFKYHLQVKICLKFEYEFVFVATKSTPCCVSNMFARLRLGFCYDIKIDSYVNQLMTHLNVDVYLV